MKEKRELLNRESYPKRGENMYRCEICGQNVTGAKISLEKMREVPKKRSNKLRLEIARSMNVCKTCAVTHGNRTTQEERFVSPEVIKFGAKPALSKRT